MTIIETANAFDLVKVVVVYGFNFNLFSFGMVVIKYFTQEGF